jgi:hypothetical protein
MKFIAHRGNVFGPNVELENSPKYIDKAISMGYDVEVDLWVKDDKFFLGHDYAQYEIDLSFINEICFKTWFHCKNKEALEKIRCTSSEINYFWHQTDDYTITSKGYFWVYPGKEAIDNSVILFPENVKEYFNIPKKIYGICSDYIYKLKYELTL